ncbi:MAG: hypothetical protein IIA88_09390 [Bacteroidetes bacterium]|nr:hypothetical protein [Bacteroidota bacterium]
MQAIRKYCEVHNGKVVVNMPKDFDSKKVEVIIIAEKGEKKASKEDDQKLSELLLKGPTLSKKEIDEWEEALKKMREWKE